ncbi:unnamed protein product [Cylindrotheca closterium]|uniref:Uncharacterized protein n=1 Tax=Cylindrotheca closterium TaxID=2856 RepID=A0AAD2PVX1_9STRA|nr:unnamed protein product [Cylindrotheca closterium]
MQEIGSADIILPDKKLQISTRCEYLRLDRAFAHFSSVLVETDEFKVEQAKKEKEWEDSHADGNVDALMKLRRHMPLNIRQMSENDLLRFESPSSKVFPRTLEIALTWEKQKVRDDATNRKIGWFSTMKSNLKEMLNTYERHMKEYGPRGSHPYATREQPNVGCPLIGRQCPSRADSVVNYDTDYGWPDGALYENPDNVKEEEAPELNPAEQAKCRRAHLISLIIEASKTRASSNSKLRPETMTFLYTLGQYLDCRKQMDAKYLEVDELQVIANFSIEMDSDGIEASGGEDGKFKPSYQQQSVHGTAATTVKEMMHEDPAIHIVKAKNRIAKPTLTVWLLRYQYVYSDRCCSRGLQIQTYL